MRARAHSKSVLARARSAAQRVTDDGAGRWPPILRSPLIATRHSNCADDEPQYGLRRWAFSASASLHRCVRETLDRHLTRNEGFSKRIRDRCRWWPKSAVKPARFRRARGIEVTSISFRDQRDSPAAAEIHEVPSAPNSAAVEVL